MKVTELPYIPTYDNTIAIILLSCFLISCLIIAKRKKILVELKDNFKTNKNHVSALSTKTNSEINSLGLLIIQTCVMVGLVVFITISYVDNNIVKEYSSLKIIGLITLISAAYLFIKWIIYSIIGWIFDKKRLTAVWLESYTTIIYFSGFALFPIVLYVVFSSTPIYVIIYFAISFLILIKSTILYKWIKLFSKKTYGHLLLILYFCALEIIPCLLIYKGIIDYINVLTINI